MQYYLPTLRIFNICRSASQVLSPDLNDIADEAWLNVTTQNNASNNIAQDKWRRVLAIPTMIYPETILVEQTTARE